MQKFIIFIILFLTACSSQIQAIPTIQPTNTSLPPTPAPSPTNTREPTPTATRIAESDFDGVRVIYIFSEGFLITVGDKSVLIDAIFDGNPEGILNPILDSQPPFENVDLILVTHDHFDHFDPQLVLRYLQNNPDTLFASSPSAVDAILALDKDMQPRLTAIDLEPGESKVLTLADINLETLYLSHGIPGLLNIGFLLYFDEATLLHIGDMNPTEVNVSDLQAYGLPDKQIDLAFIHTYPSPSTIHPHVTEGIQARHIIPMHFGTRPPSGLADYFPNMTILQDPYEAWVMP